MKHIQYIYLTMCPHCWKANRLIKKARQEFPELQTVKIEKLNWLNHRDLSSRYGFHLVPTFIVDGEKVHEGAVDSPTIERVLRSAL